MDRALSSEADRSEKRKLNDGAVRYSLQTNSPVVSLA